jgi:hypothetical protein
MHGQTVCESHGGAQGSAKAKAAANIELANARQQMTTYGLPMDVGIEDGLLGQLAASAGHIDYLVGIIRGLDPRALVWGVTTREGKKGLDAGKPTALAAETQAAGLTAWMVLYFAERRMYLDFLKTAFAVKLEQRRMDQAVEAAKVQAQFMVACVNAITNDPALASVLTDEAKDMVRLAVSRQFKLLSEAA